MLDLHSTTQVLSRLHAYAIQFQANVVQCKSVLKEFNDIIMEYSYGSNDFE